MKICICDDNKETCLKIENLLNKFFLHRIKTKKIDLDFKKEIIKCYSGTNLSNFLIQGEEFDLIFLDIRLEDMLGYEIANALRNKLKNIKTQIIYISTEKEYALDLFESNPFDFLIKPITEKNIFNVMDKFFRYFFESGEDKFFNYKKNRISCKEPLKNILYFESNGRKIIIHCKDREDEFYAKLSDVKKELKDPFFIQIHQSIIINYYNVKEVGSETVLMTNGEILNITRLYKDEIQEFILNNNVKEDR